MTLFALFVACTAETPDATDVGPEVVQTEDGPVEVPAALVEGFALSGDDVASFAGVTTSRVGLRGDLIYAAVVNQTGTSWRNLDVGLVLLEQGSVVYDEGVYCYASDGGRVVPAGATARCCRRPSAGSSATPTARSS